MFCWYKSTYLGCLNKMFDLNNTSYSKLDYAMIWQKSYLFLACFIYARLTNTHHIKFVEILYAVQIHKSLKHSYCWAVITAFLFCITSEFVLLQPTKATFHGHSFEHVHLWFLSFLTKPWLYMWKNVDVCGSCVSCSHMTSVRPWRSMIRFSETTLFNLHEYSWLWIMLLKDAVCSCDNDLMGSYSISWSVVTLQEKGTLVCFPVSW